MGSRGFFPSTDSGALSFATQLSRKLSESPEAFGVDEASAAEFADLAAVFAERLRVAVRPSTRTVISVMRKNDSRREMRRAASALARRIYAFPGITNEQLSTLGLTIRKPATEVAKPTAQPWITVLKAEGRTITLSVRNPTRVRGARPDGTLGVMLFRCLGVRPGGEKSWVFDQISSDPILQVKFDTTVPNGTPVWFRAQYVGERLTRGPWSVEVVTNLPGCNDTAGIGLMAA